MVWIIVTLSVALAASWVIIFVLATIAKFNLHESERRR